MADIATMRMKALHFWDKHGISAASEAFGVSCRTLYWWRQLLNKEGPEGLIPHRKAPLVRRKKHWHPDVLKIRTSGQSCRTSVKSRFLFA